MRSAALGVALLLAVVSGCSARDAAPAEVGPLASGSVSTGPSDTPASVRPDSRANSTSGPAERPVEPSVPSAAAASDSAGASAFARHFIATLQAALASGDSRALASLSAPSCGGCTNLMEAIAAAASAGHRVRRAELVVAFSEAPQVRDGETIVDLRYQRRAGDVVNASGDIVQAIPAEGAIDTQLRVTHTGSGWLVLGFRRLPG